MTMVDIQGLEDFFGDMDFKVGGTHKGITAIQVGRLSLPLPDGCLALWKVLMETAPLYRLIMWYLITGRAACQVVQQALFVVK